MDKDGTDGTDLAEPTRSDIDDMIDAIDAAIAECRYKIEEGRIRDAEKAKARVKYLRAMGYLVRSKKKVVELRSLEELGEQIEELQAAQARERYR